MPILPLAPRRGRVRAKRRTQGMHQPHPRHFRANGSKAATGRGMVVDHTFFTATNPTSATTHPLSPSHFPPLSKGEIQRGSQGEGTGRPRGGRVASFRGQHPTAKALPHSKPHSLDPARGPSAIPPSFPRTREPRENKARRLRGNRPNWPRADVQPLSRSAAEGQHKRAGNGTAPFAKRRGASKRSNANGICTGWGRAARLPPLDEKRATPVALGYAKVVRYPR